MPTISINIYRLVYRVDIFVYVCCLCICIRFVWVCLCIHYSGPFKYIYKFFKISNRVYIHFWSKRGVGEEGTVEGGV